MIDFDINKVREYYQFITDNTSTYEEFEIALLIHERVWGIWKPEEITEELAEKVQKLLDRDTLFDYDLNCDLEIINREVEEAVAEQEINN